MISTFLTETPAWRRGGSAKLVRSDRPGIHEATAARQVRRENTVSRPNPSHGGAVTTELTAHKQGS